MRLIDYFDRGADLYPERHCLHDGTPGWTYREVRAQTHHLAKDKLGGVKAPKSVDFIATLPRSPVGKVLKKNLREPYWAGHDRKI